MWAFLVGENDYSWTNSDLIMVFLFTSYLYFVGAT